MESNKIKETIWVEKLSLIEAVLFLIRSLFSPIAVRYDENQISSLVKIFLVSFQKINLCNNFYPAGLSLDKKDKFGYSLYYRMHKKLNNCMEAFCNKYIPEKSDKFKIMVKSYMTMYLSGRISFIAMVEAELQLRGFNGKSKNTLYLKPHPLNSVLSQFYRIEGYRLSIPVLSLGYFRHYIKPLYYLVNILLAKFTFQRVQKNIDPVKPSIWVEYLQDTSLDFTFWKDNLNQKDFDIVYYIDRKDCFPARRIVSTLNNQGKKWIVLSFRSLVKISNIRLLDLKDVIGLLFSFSSDYPLWYRILQFEYKAQILFYKSLFKQFKTKILIQHQEYFWIQEPQAEAIESVGGIMLGFHWSFYYFKSYYTLNPQHVFFAWGSLMYNWLQKRGNTCRYIIPSGICMINEAEKQKCLEPFSEKLKFVIVVFDSSVAYNLHQSPDSLDKFYLSVLNLLENNSQWGGIAKSKNWRFNDLKFLPHGKDIMSRITSLINQGRWIMLDPGCSPLTPAAHANLCVCFGLNSAGIICGIHGFRAVHWDFNGFMHSPFYEDLNQQVIYPDLCAFEQAIIKVSNGDREIGDFSGWRQRCNYFGDFNAKRRVGRFIQSFMERSKDSTDIEYLLSSAVKEYISENNIDERFFSIKDWWNNE